ncbi:MAG: sigma-70 family RNA polymerase sigma factor [Myxococcota bacterium]
MVVRDEPDPRPREVAPEREPPTIDRAIAQWLPAVYGWCARLGAGRIDAEEAAHDVMMILVRRYDTPEGPRNLPAWLFGTCRRVVANHRRRAWWWRWVPGVSLDHRVAPDRTDGPSDDREFTEAVARAMDALTVEHREVLVLCYFEDRSVVEAGAILGVPPGTVKSRLHYARGQFQASFEREWR